MARPSNLEVQLTAVTQRFVAEVVEMIRHASVADVAGFDVRRLTGAGAGGGPGSSSSLPPASSSQLSVAPRRGRPPKLTIDAGHSATGRGSASSSAASASRSAPPASRENDRRPRQTAELRAELGERVLAALLHAPEPLGVRALADELHVAPDLLSAPLLELRAAGKLTKHGEKRATTYAAVR